MSYIRTLLNALKAIFVKKEEIDKLKSDGGVGYKKIVYDSISFEADLTESEPDAQEEGYAWFEGSTIALSPEIVGSLCKVKINSTKYNVICKENTLFEAPTLYFGNASLGRESEYVPEDSDSDADYYIEMGFNSDTDLWEVWFVGEVGHTYSISIDFPRGVINKIDPKFNDAYVIKGLDWDWFSQGYVPDELMPEFAPQVKKILDNYKINDYSPVYIDIDDCVYNCFVLDKSYSDNDSPEMCLVFDDYGGQYYGVDIGKYFNDDTQEYDYVIYGLYRWVSSPVYIDDTLLLRTEYFTGEIVPEDDIIDSVLNIMTNAYYQNSTFIRIGFNKGSGEDFENLYSIGRISNSYRSGNIDRDLMLYVLFDYPDLGQLYIKVFLNNNVEFGINKFGASLPETTNLIKGDGSGGALAASPDVDYATPALVSEKYTKPSSGIPASDIADGVIPESEQASETAIDTVVTSGSSNLITSGAVYTVVGDIDSALNNILTLIGGGS